jgi:hypothetical protein
MIFLMIFEANFGAGVTMNSILGEFSLKVKVSGMVFKTLYIEEN